MKRLLVVDLAYTRDEVNEPINIDTLLDCLEELYDTVSVDILYRTLGDTAPFTPEDYDIILVSTKISSGDALDEILSRKSQTPTIVGGVIATYAHRELLSRYPDVILSLGECEQNIKETVSALLTLPTVDAAKEHLIKASVSGLAFMHRGARYHADIRPVDLSRITKPLTHRALSRTLAASGLVRIEGSRGCPWNACRFCACRYKYRCDHRPFPLSKTLGEIAMLSRAGVKTLYFTDEDFFGSREHFFSLFGEILQRKERKEFSEELSFWGSTSVYTLIRFGEKLDEAIALMKAVGIGVLFLGIESGSDSQLLRFNKGVTANENLFILKKLKEAGINVDVGFIMFDALTTLDEVRENLAFTRRSGLDKTVSRLAKPLRVIPYTDMAKEYEALSLLTSDTDLGELDHTYKIRDEKVAALYEALTVLDSHILDAANRLQAKIRMASGYEDEDTLKALTLLRGVEYRFIEDFLAAFSENSFDPDLLHALLQKHLARLL